MSAHFEAGAEPGRLRCDADVADHGNTGTGDRADTIGLVAPALELHRACSALFNQSNRGTQRVFVADLVGTERHVGHDMRARRSAHDGLRVIENALERYRRGFVKAQNDVADAVADQDDVDAGSFHKLSERRIVGGCNWKGRFALSTFDGARRQTAYRRILLRLVRTGALAVTLSLPRFHTFNSEDLAPLPDTLPSLLSSSARRRMRG